MMLDSLLNFSKNLYFPFKKRNSQLENEACKKREKVSVESQTTMECDSCGYPPDDFLDFGEHQFQCHGPVDEPKDDSIICYICGWKLKSYGDLMDHRKESMLKMLESAVIILKASVNLVMKSISTNTLSLKILLKP